MSTKQQSITATYRRSSIINEPDGGEMAPAKLPLCYITAARKLIADSNSMITTFPVRVNSLIVL